VLHLLLVSQSFRRQKILTEGGFLFRVDTVKLSEILEENVNPRTAIEQLARTKAEAYLAEHNELKSQNILVLTADTDVFLAGKVLGKPNSAAQAVEFLYKLSGKTHSVITGLCLWNLETGESLTVSAETLVKFHALSPEAIAAYVATGDPMDKAGGYGIQGKAREFVERIDGEFDNVVGLPLRLLEDTLRKKNWNVARR
jgi:septum formation protein